MIQRMVNAAAETVAMDLQKKDLFCPDCTSFVHEDVAESFSRFKRSQFLICPFCLSRVYTVVGDNIE